MHKSHETITSPMGPEYENVKMPRPTGHVETEGKVANVSLPTRTMGPDSVREVFYDGNMGLPERSGGGK